MFIVVQHRIADPATFWNIAKASMPHLPRGVRLHSVLPNADGSNAVCLWEAATLDTINKFVEASVGQMSTNQYFEVDAKNAVGLPEQEKGARLDHLTPS